MPEQRSTPSFAEYLTVGEAAQFLGVSPWTLRNWDKAGRLKPTRHPKNGYRIYRHEDLAAVLKSAAAPARQANPSNSLLNDIGKHEHFVQFYESDDFLTSSVAQYAGDGLLAGEAAVVVATADHRRDIERQIEARGCNLAAARHNGTYLAFDARETLDQFTSNGGLDRERFDNVVGKVIASATAGSQKLRAFGEMVALLWTDSKREAAIHLEELWNQQQRSHPFSLFCAYPMRAFSTSADTQLLHDVCACHSRVIPAESYAQLADEQAKARAITALQHKARSLEAEITHRQAVERQLIEAQHGVEHASSERDQLIANLAREISASLTSIQNDPALPRHLHGELAVIRRKIDSLKTIKQASLGPIH